MLRSTFFFLITLCSLPLLAQTTETEYKLMREDKSFIHYYLTRFNISDSSDSLLLVLQGSDCNSVTKIKSVYELYSSVLPNSDMLLVEKYGISSSLAYDKNPERKDCPASFIANDSLSQRVQDAESALNVVMSKKKYKDVILIGGSEGAVVANLLSAKLPFITATISFNGGGQKFIDDVIYNISKTSKSASEANDAISGITGFSQHIVNSGPSEIVVSGHGYKWWKEMLVADQLNILDKVINPVLIIQGGEDIAVSPEKVNSMINKLQSKSKGNIHYQFYPHLDHNFKNLKGNNEFDKVTLGMKEWLKGLH